MIINNLSNSSHFPTEVLNSSIPVLVIFSASWCAPCKTLKDSIDEIIKNYQESGKQINFKIVIIDVDKHQSLTSEYGIRSVPTCLLFVNNTIKETFQGRIDVFSLFNTINNYAS